MEQRENTQRLLSLEEEVKALKILNGGVLSGLQSTINEFEQRIYNLEHRIQTPDFTKVTALYYRQNSNGEELFLPGYDGDKITKTDPVYIPRTGYGWIYLFFQGGIIDGSGTSPLCRCFINGNLILSGDNESRHEMFFPVNAGDYFQFGTRVKGTAESSNVSPNSSYWVCRFMLYDIQNKAG